MRIALVAPPFLPCPPQGYGGVERVVDLLARGLVQLGNDVTVFGHAESFGDAGKERPHLVPSQAPVGRVAPDLAEVLHVREAAHHIAVGGFDLVHDHTRFGALELAALPVPVLTTAHYDVGSDPGAWVFEQTRHLPHVALSAAQRGLTPPDSNWAAVVPNGIDLDEFRPGPGMASAPDGYLLHIAALGVRKGTDAAIRIAEIAGRRLVVVGAPDHADPRGYREVVQPLLDQPHVDYRGELGGAEKVRVFQDAAALLHPVAFDEPFGLVYIEALACGVPVLTLRRGAAPEIVEHGVTGYLGTDWEDLIAPATKLPDYDPRTCRASAHRYSSDTMVRAYDALYRTLRT